MTVFSLLSVLALQSDKLFIVSAFWLSWETGDEKEKFISETWLIIANDSTLGINFFRFLPVKVPNVLVLAFHLQASMKLHAQPFNPLAIHRLSKNY